MSTPSDSTARDVLLADLIEVRRRARRPRRLKVVRRGKRWSHVLAMGGDAKAMTGAS